MILSEIFKGKDKTKLKEYLDSISLELGKINFDTTNTRKLDAIIQNVSRTLPELQEYTKSIEHKVNITDIELSTILLSIQKGFMENIDPKEYQHLFRAGLGLIESPEQFDITQTNLIDAIQKPIPDGIIFPYAGEHIIKIRAGVPTIIGAYTGIGKSSVMLNMAYNYYKQSLELEELKKKNNDIVELKRKELEELEKKNIEKKELESKRKELEELKKKKLEPLKQWIYSLEMSSTDIAVYLLQLLIQDNRTYTSEKTDGYTVYKNWMQYEQELSSLNKYITVYSNDNRIDQISIKEIEVRLEYAAATNTLPDIVYIDYLQIIEQEKLKDPNQDRRFQIIDIVGRLAQIAKKYKIYLVLLSQANRAGVDISSLKDSMYQGTRFPAPSMGSLQESSFIEQTAGLVLMLGRVYIKEKEKEYDILEVSIEKNRYGSSRINTFYCIDKVSRLIGKIDQDFSKEINSQKKNSK